ncbi:hypothetical protein K488DRAFT_83547 [Vararia minispora EC-137]|uniref:Uncharacterized protein n=1 Tax=Vararia minispora EC-137 TaxID=1314806 RepID=A0ACB8QTF3_9AGAM|nr:hypothetical protein K488DRAFT_83547 [Vararia minispora EC-137]
MTAHTVELKKQLYSQELVEYTMRQWEQARLEMESRTKGNGGQSTPTPPYHPISTTTRSPQLLSHANVPSVSS